MPLDNSNSSPDDSPDPQVIPPLGERSTPTSGVIRRPIFAADGPHRVLRGTPQPPAGPPPSFRVDASDPLANALEMKLPGIIGQGGDPNAPAESTRDGAVGGEALGEKIAVGNTVKRIDSTARQTIACPPSVRLGALTEAPGADEVAMSSAVSSAEARVPADIELAARRAQRVAKVRTIAQEVSKVGEIDGSAKVDDAERGEIQRALAAVDETRRKRMERQQTEHGGLEQDEEKLRRRQAKREQLMKKRKDMEVRLEEEASKMAELTESAKKKGETKFMSEEAKRDAEERIRAEAEAVIQLEQQAADMALRRENMRRQLAQASEEKAAEIELRANSALKTKRALVEARMKREEEEIKNLSEAAKREVEAKMVAEAAAIADMERKAVQMASKRVALEAEMSSRILHENALLEEAEQISRKRQAVEIKMQREEAELQKLSDEAKQRVLEKMAAEAAAIAEMEREANELAVERAALASQMARQRASTAARAKADIIEQEHSADSGQVPCAETLPAGNETLPAGKETLPASNEPLPPGSESDYCTGGGGSHELAGEVEDGRSLETKQFTSAVESGATQDDDQWTEPNLVQDQQFVDVDGVCTHCRATQQDMSSAHLAAAAGHLACLEAFQRGVSSELLVSVDSAGRSPLFYACASAHADATDLLIQEGPQSCHVMDVNRDTPLHAAALAGSALCCRLLLHQGRSEVEPLNAMNMTPAHLAANTDVLEVLSQHGANLNAKDVDSRTPLFVACASDRLEKAEFLCELLECAGQDLAEADKRGDTPMHAAAYNGSTACLLLLLQSGVAPDVRNSKGLRPIDLASRRGQSACEKILMEYQLHHHVNNSYFDSVLFLATLEGHRRCKEVLTDDTERISPREGAMENSPLNRPESMWSLRRGRSVRLEHWGDWIAYEDQNAQSVFWYNHVAQTSQWEAPADIRQTSSNTPANSSMRLKREGDWIEYTLPDGNVFFYNDRNNEFQWERPDQLLDNPGEEPLEGDTVADATTGDWAAFKDPSTGLVFWYNQVTGESQWEPPEELSAAGPLPELGGTSIALEEDVREVNSVDDLFTPR